MRVYAFAAGGVVVKAIQILIEIGSKKFILKENVPITLFYFLFLFVWVFFVPLENFHV